MCDPLKPLRHALSNKRVAHYPRKIMPIDGSNFSFSTYFFVGKRKRNRSRKLGDWVRPGEIHTTRPRLVFEELDEAQGENERGRGRKRSFRHEEKDSTSTKSSFLSAFAVSCVYVCARVADDAAGSFRPRRVLWYRSSNRNDLFLQKSPPHQFTTLFFRSIRLGRSVFHSVPCCVLFVSIFFPLFIYIYICMSLSKRQEFTNFPDSRIRKLFSTEKNVQFLSILSPAGVLASRCVCVCIRCNTVFSG